jgi:DNA-binding response OmpR family regulator
MNIFIVEDDFVLSKALVTFFKIKDYSISHYSDGEDALDNISLDNLHDIYIVDLNLPNISGLDLVKYIRKIDNNVPIVIITASVDIINLEDAYSFGCSEYIKKPFNLKELDIRLNRLLKINNNIIISLGESIKFDITNSQLIIDNNILELRKKELRFLSLLFLNINNIVHTDTIEDYVWEGEIKESYPLRQLLNGLRKKIKYDFIKTEIGMGYKINENY